MPAPLAFASLEKGIQQFVGRLLHASPAKEAVVKGASARQVFGDDVFNTPFFLEMRAKIDANRLAKPVLRVPPEPPGAISRFFGWAEAKQMFEDSMFKH